MNGWQRFGVLLVVAFITMVFFPDFGVKGWKFVGMTGLLWTCAIMVISLISNILGIYNLEGLNRFISVLILGLIIYTFLWHFPLNDDSRPILQLQAGKIPTQEDMKRGLRRFTFNFYFVGRNVHNEKNFANQQEDLQKLKPTKEEAPKPVKKVEKIEIVVE